MMSTQINLSKRPPVIALSANNSGGVPRGCLLQQRPHRVPAPASTSAIITARPALQLDGITSQQLPSHLQHGQADTVEATYSSSKARRPLLTRMDPMHIHAISMTAALAASAYINVAEVATLASNSCAHMWYPTNPAVIALVAASTVAGVASGALMATQHRRGVQRDTMLAMAFMALAGVGLEVSAARPYLPEWLDAAELMTGSGVAFLASAACLLAPLFGSDRHRLLHGGARTAMHSVDDGGDSVAPSPPAGIVTADNVLPGLAYVGPSVAGAALAAITGIALLSPDAEAKALLFQGYPEFDAFVLLTAVRPATCAL